MVLRFLCGIKKLIYPSEVLNTLCVEKSGGESSAPFDTLHWLFEAQNNDVITKLLGSSDIQPITGYTTVTPFDCFVLGYCMSHSNCTWIIENPANLGRYSIERYPIGDEGVQMLMRGSGEKSNCIGGISEINLKTLNLGGNKLGSKSCAALAHLIQHAPHLKNLDLSGNYKLRQGGAVHVITSLKHTNSIEKLSLRDIAIGVEDCRALGELLSSSTSLKNLSIQIISHEAGELIISGLHHNTTLTHLSMWRSHFSLQNIKSFASLLKTNHTLVDLGLWDCNIDSDGAHQLASALCTNDTLQKLNMGHNPIKVEGATAFAEMLLKNKSLKVLNLRGIYMFEIGGEEGAQKLIDSLTHNTTLELLWLPQILNFDSSIDSSKVNNKRIHFSH